MELSKYKLALVFEQLDESFKVGKKSRQLRAPSLFGALSFELLVLERRAGGGDSRNDQIMDEVEQQPGDGRC